MVFNDTINVDLNKPLARSRAVLSSGDNNANCFGASIYQDGKVVDISGYSVTGYFVTPDGDTLVITGIAEGNTAQVTLPNACYANEGSGTLAIKVSGGKFTGTVRVVDCHIRTVETDNLYDPGDAVPTLDELLAQIAAMEQATAAANTAANNAKEFIVTVTVPQYIIDGDMSGITSDKTYAEIRAAITAGKTPVVKLVTKGKAETEILHLYSFAPVSIIFRQHMRTPSTYNVSGSHQLTFVSTGSITLSSVSIKSVPDGGADGQVLVHKGESTYEWRDSGELAVVADLAPAIIPTAQGAGIVAIPDSANRPLVGLRLYGKTTQNGVPTPSAPVPLVNVGAGGSIGVKASGKNLIDMRGAAGGTSSGVTVTVNADGSYTINGTATDINVNVWFAGYFDADAPTLFVLPAGTYYVAGIALYSGVRFVSDNYQAAGSYFTLAEDTPITGVRCTFVTSGQTYSNTVVYPIVAAGNGVATFEPYVDGGSLTASTPGGFAGIPSGGGMLCDYTEYGLATHVQLVQRIVLNGSENITYDGDAFNVPGAIQSGGRAYMQGMCSHYPVATNYHEFISGDYAVCNWANNALRIRHGGNTDVASFKAWLASNPVTLYFPLPTPRYTTVSADEMAAYRAMKTLKPHTVVYNDAGAVMHVDYIADTKNYIDQRISALLNA